MKSTIVFAVVVYCLIVSVSCWAAEAPPEPQSFAMSSLSQLRTAKAGSPSTRIGAAGRVELTVPGVLEVTQSVVEGSPAYRTGDGVVLRPPQLMDVTTSSYAMVTQADVYYSVVAAIKMNSPTSYVPIVFRTAQNPVFPMIMGTFQKLPYSLRTYMLTLGLRGGTLAGRLRVRVGNTEIPPSSLVINAATGEVRVLFTYDASGANHGRLAVNAYKTGPLGGMWYFNHVRLAQLD